MTFRTFEIDAAHGTSNEDINAPARHARRRRRALTLTHRTGGTRIAGFGI